MFINVDRAIAYGLTERTPGYDHQGGTIRNNFIVYQSGLMGANRTASSDGAIIVWDSPTSLVYHNSILTNGNVVHSIEFRFVATTGGEARNNLADASINLRDGAAAMESGNLLTAAPNFFVAPASGDLHLLATASAAIDQAPTFAAVTDDIDGVSRPQGCCYDLGADEFDVGGGADGGGPLGDGGTSPPVSGVQATAARPSTGWAAAAAVAPRVCLWLSCLFLSAYSS